MKTKNKILIYCHVQLWEIHLAEVVEIALKHVALNDEVTIVYCEGALTSCPANPENKASLCRACRQKTYHIKNKLLARCEAITLNIDGHSSFDVSNIQSLDDLREKYHHKLPIGSLVLSQLVDSERDCYLDIRRYKNRIMSWGDNGIGLYSAMVKLFRDKRFDKVYIWNGRRVSDGPVYYAASDNLISAEVFISGGKTNTYMSIAAPYVHHLQTHKNRINRVKEKISCGGISDYRIEAEKFYNNQRYGCEPFPGYVQFSKNFSEEFDVVKHKPLLVIFTSSFFEFFSMKEYCGGIFQNHYDGLMKILNDPAIFEKYDLIVRWHPNLSTAGPNELKIIKTIIAATERRGIIHIKPDGCEDSYQLLESANAVLSFGSTIGVEAAYYGKPSILMGRQWYEGLDCVYRPQSYDELVSLLLSDPRPLPLDDAIAYGYYMRNYGEYSFRYVEFRGYGNKPFVRDIPLHPSTFGSGLRGLLRKSVTLRNIVKVVGERL